MPTKNNSAILHVVESFGGGVSDAVNCFRIATPEFEHHLLYALRPGVDVEFRVRGTWQTSPNQG